MLATFLPGRVRLAIYRLELQLGNLLALWKQPARPLFVSVFTIPEGTYRQVEPGVHAGSGAGAAAALASPAPASSRRHRVWYLRSAAMLEVAEEQTLLQAGLEAGLQLASACRMGLCGTCKVRLLEGEVEMAQPNALSDQERARGYCLPCVSRPRGAVKLEA